jgi:signal transduction histidine kinase
LVTRSFIVLTSALTLLGLAGDALPAAERARHRSNLEMAPGTPLPMRFAAWLRAYVDELSPGRGRARRAVLAERTRVARDIHADVVPGIRRVLADAERGVPAESLAGSLRDILDDVEAVGAVQHPIQLEIGGIVAALEWLAERVESRSDITVNLEVADSSPDAAAEPPREVAAAAFRIAALALDNVARHVPGGTAVVDVRAEADAVDLSISDDGPGIGGEALTAARGSGRRGLADMAAEADECGGTFEIAPGPGQAGTRVAFAWRPAGRR